MSLPIFGPDYLASPTMEGAVSHTTANLMAQQGAMLAKQIETKSQQAEAQAKAPAIATLYAQAMTRISEGDFSGFGELERGNAMSVGNPFLENMSKEASDFASRMAGNYMQSQQQLLSQKHAALMQEDRQSFEAEQADRRFKQQSGMHDKVLARQAENDFRDAKVKHEQIVAELEYKHQQAQEAENQIAEAEGRQPRIVPKPPVPKAPVAEDFLPALSGGSEDMGPLFRQDADPVTAMPPPGQSNFDPNATGLPSPEDDSIIPGIPRPLVNESQPKSIPSPSAAIQAAVGNANQYAERQFGRLAVKFPAPDETPVKSIDRNIKGPNGSVTIKSEAPKRYQNEFNAALSSVTGQDPEFAEWSSTQMIEGKKVRLEPDPERKGLFRAYSTNKDGTEEPFGEVGQNQQPTGVNRLVTKEVADNFNKMKSLIEGELKGKVQIYKHLPENRRESLVNDFKKAILEGRSSPENALKELAPYGLTISKEEIDSILKEKTSYGKVHRAVPM